MYLLYESYTDEYLNTKEIKDINFNSSECLKSYDLLGTTEYVNLCNDEINTIPWGVEGWLMFVITIIMILLLLGGVVAIVKDLFFD